MVKNLSLTPLHTMQESDTLWHEIGQVVDSAEKGLYYVRWVKVNNDWQMAFDCMAIGAKPSNRPLRTSLSDIPDWLQAQDKTFADKFKLRGLCGAAGFVQPWGAAHPPDRRRVFEAAADRCLFPGGCEGRDEEPCTAPIGGVRRVPHAGARAGTVQLHGRWTPLLHALDQQPRDLADRLRHHGRWDELSGVLVSYLPPPPPPP
eukprot:Sspe_Gene.91814::Locus_63438_Transcript_1_1_Confidence_1.000_Length_891::g.91814::m.91814